MRVAGGQLRGGAGLPVGQGGGQRGQLVPGAVAAGDRDVVFDDPQRDAAGAVSQEGPVGAVGQGLQQRKGNTGLDPHQQVRPGGADLPDQREAGELAVHQEKAARREDLRMDPDQPPGQGLLPVQRRPGFQAQGAAGAGRGGDHGAHLRERRGVIRSARGAEVLPVLAGVRDGDLEAVQRAQQEPPPRHPRLQRAGDLPEQGLEQLGGDQVAAAGQRLGTRHVPRARPRHVLQQAGRPADHLRDVRLRPQRHRHHQPDRHRGRQQPLPFLPAAEILHQLLDLAGRHVRLQHAGRHVIRQPPAGLHLAAPADHRRRHRHLMAEHQVLARPHRLPGSRPSHQGRRSALAGKTQVTRPERDDPRRRADIVTLRRDSASRQNRIELHARLLGELTRHQSSYQEPPRKSAVYGRQTRGTSSQFRDRPGPCPGVLGLPRARRRPGDGRSPVPVRIFAVIGGPWSPGGSVLKREAG